MSVRHASPATLAALRSASQPGHLRRQSRLVDEHELRRVEIELAIEPDQGALQDVWAVLLQCMRGLLWDGPPLPPAPSYGAGVFERKERTDDHRDPWN